MTAFLSGFSDELYKLAQPPYQGRPPEISKNQPSGPGSFDWGTFQKKFKAEVDQARSRRLFKEKGGSGLLPPEKREWIDAPPPAKEKPKPVRKPVRRYVPKPKPPASSSDLVKIEPRTHFYHTGTSTRTQDAYAVPGVGFKLKGTSPPTGPVHHYLVPPTKLRSYSDQPQKPKSSPTTQVEP